MSKRFVFAMLSLVGCGAAANQAKNGEPAPPVKEPSSAATAVATVAPPDKVSAEVEPKDCCAQECSTDEQTSWDRCDGSELAKKVADEWTGLVGGYQYERGAAGTALLTAKVYMSAAGPGKFKCEGDAGPDCLIVYTDEQAAKRSCKTPKPVAVAFGTIAKRAAEQKVPVVVSCL